MTFKEAILSKKPMKRAPWKVWCVHPKLNDMDLRPEAKPHCYVTLNFGDILADDWEVKP